MGTKVTTCPTTNLLSKEQESYLRLHSPGEAILFALNTLLRNDSYLLHIDVHERTIASRFSMYLQTEFPHWHVDCEFNRDMNDPKRLLALKTCNCNQQQIANCVVPDVIVHRRGTTDNLLALEFKKSSSRDMDIHHDRHKLRQYKLQLKYQHGLLVELNTGSNAAVNNIEWIYGDV